MSVMSRSRVLRAAGSGAASGATRGAAVVVVVVVCCAVCNGCGAGWAAATVLVSLRDWAVGYNTSTT